MFLSLFFLNYSSIAMTGVQVVNTSMAVRVVELASVYINMWVAQDTSCPSNSCGEHGPEWTHARVDRDLSILSIVGGIDVVQSRVMAGSLVWSMAITGLWLW